MSNEAEKLLSQANQTLQYMWPNVYAGAAPNLVAHIEHFREDKDGAFLAHEVTGIKQPAHDSYEKRVGHLQTYESLYVDTIQLLKKLEKEALSFLETLSKKSPRQRKSEHTAVLTQRGEALDEIARNCSLAIYIIMTSDKETLEHMFIHPDFVDLWTALPKDPSTLG